MDSCDFWNALDCPREKFDELIERMDEQWRFFAEDYGMGVVRMDDVARYLDSAHRRVYDALGGFWLNGGQGGQFRYRCSSDEAFGSLLADHAAWNIGNPTVEHPDREWLFMSTGDRGGVRRIAPAGPEQKARLFCLCDASAFSVRRFAHAFDGVEVPRYSIHEYATGTYCTVDESFIEDGGFLDDPDPVGKTFRICSEEGTEGEVTATGTGTAHFGGDDAGYFTASGYVTGYADTCKDPSCEIELFGHGTARLSVSFFRRSNAAASQNLPIRIHGRWRQYRKAKAELERWVAEDEKLLLVERLWDCGLGDAGDRIADCIFG